MTKTFSVTNYKGIRGEVTIAPEGNVAIIAGPNGSGKSSFIDAIAELFDPKGTKLTPRPIHDGADEATAEFTDTDLGYRVVRRWKKNGPGELSVYALDGAKYDKPSERIAALVGGLLFDPVRFLQMSAADQRDALLAKSTIPVDLDQLEARKRGAEEARTEKGREVKRLEGALGSLPKPDADAADEEVSASQIIARIQEAEERSRAIADADRGLEQAAAEITRLEAELENWRATRESRAAHRATLLQGEDVSELRKQLEDVEATNAAIRAAKQYKAAADELEAARAAHQAEQAKLDAIAEEKKAALAQAVFPDALLGVDDDGVTLGGVPFSQANSAARVRAAFNVATAGRQELRLVIVKDGDLLDAESLAEIDAIAAERGYTVLIERGRPDVGDGLLAQVVTLADGTVAG